jgi:CPA2 family monovalent cation:H+ antiporter-2
LLPAEVLDGIVVYAVGTMMLGTLFYPFANPFAVFVANRFLPGAADVDPDPTPGEHQSFDNHVIVVGYGITGSNLCRMLKATYVPHCVVEMNQSLVKNARDAGESVIVGDATRLSILEHAGIDKARVLVVAINDKQATQRIVGQVSARRPELYVLARTGFATDIEALYQRGATLVIPADFETSIEVAAHVLKKFGVPDNIIEAQVNAVRTGGYAMLRGTPTTRAAQTELMKILERTTIQTFYLAEGAVACGHTIAELNLRAATGCTIIAVVRGGNPTTNPDPDYVLQPNDVMVLVGAHIQIEAAKALLQKEN